MSKNKMIYLLITIGYLVAMAIALGIQYLSDKSSEEDKTEIIGEGKKDKEEILEAINSNNAETQLKLNALSDAVKNIQNPTFNLEEKYGITNEQLEVFAKDIHKFSDSKLNSGLAKFFLNNYRKAEDEFSQAITLNPENSKAYFFRALTNFFLVDNLDISGTTDINSNIFYDPIVRKNNERYDSIEADLNESIKLKPDFFTFQLLGFVNSKKLEYSKAVDYYSESINLKDNYSPAYSERGVAYAKQVENYLNTGENDKAKLLSEKAIVDFNKSINLDPNIEVFYANRGTFYVVLDKHNLAVNDLEKAIELNEKFAQPHFIMGFYLAKKENFKDALSHYSTSIDLNSKNPEAFFNRAMIYKNYYQDYKKALSDLNSSLEISPNNSKALTEKAIIVGTNFGEKKKAIDLFSKIIEIDENNIDAYNNRAIAYFENKQFDNALKDFTIVLNKQPYDWEAYYLRSMVHRALNNDNLAASDFFQALRINPDLPKLIEAKKNKLK